MRNFSLFTLIALLAGQVVALPSAFGRLANWARSSAESEAATQCLTSSSAQTVATNFQNLIADYSASAANASLTPDFTDYSDSVAELINSGCTNGPQKLGAATFTSRADFEAGQGGQPPIPFKQLKVWNTCDTVFLHWESQQTPQLVTGIIVLETEWTNGTFLIHTVYSEFNSGAWLVNLGVFQPSNCPA